MITSIISKVVVLDNCNKDMLLKALYKIQFWKTVNPAISMEAKFISPNVLHTKLLDEIVIFHNQLGTIPIETEGELVLQDKGEQAEGKGRLLEINVRNNKDVKELNGRLRIKELSINRTKFGIFIKDFKLKSDFLNLIGKNVSELILRTKITEMVRNLERWVKNNSLNDLF